MNAQEIFDTVAKHLAAQGRPAHKGPSSRACAYRAHDGLKCAVGVLILDEEYDPDWDQNTKTVTELAAMGKLPTRLMEHCELLGKLQDAHDYAASGECLRNRLLEVAGAFALSPAVLDALTFPDKWA
jgi:hypothetical protein